jgi:hypothetical protein
MRRAAERPANSMELVTHLIESPRLVQALRELPAPVLGKLIDAVGLESAGDVVALATTEQLGALFDEDLWTARDAGPEERFDAPRFALWLRVLFEAGDAAVVERLSALSPDFLTLVVSRLVLVVDIDRLGVELSESDEDERNSTEKALESCLFDEWEEFRLIARDADAWDVIWDALLALDRDDHDFVRSLLERAAAVSSEYIDDNGGLVEVLSSDEMLEGDVRAERDDRRAAKGYVSGPDARAFLELAKRGDGPDGERDPITRAYFRELVRDAAPKKAAASSRKNAAQVRRRRDLVERLEAAQVLDASASRPLAGLLGSGAASGRSMLERALGELADTKPELYAERLEELGYLANVLVSGLGTRDRRLRPVDALEIALELTGFELARTADAHALDVLTKTPMDRLFRPAYRALFEAGRDLEVERLRRLLGGFLA